jgi:hypothetical protein
LFGKVTCLGEQGKTPLHEPALEPEPLNPGTSMNPFEF